jgi:hypothetical protein
MTFVVREARAADLPEMAKLLALRDREDGVREPATYEVVARQLRDLDPARCRAFVAVDPNGHVAAMNAALLRTLREGDRLIPAAYWTNLYVHPDHRNAMLYPRVVTPLRQAMASDGRLLYAAIRREAVAKAHDRIGFHRVATLPLLIKPLRPMRLASRRFKPAGLLTWLDPFWAWGSGLNFKVSPSDDTFDFRPDPNVIAAAWTDAELEERLLPTFPGDVSGVMTGSGGRVIWQDATRMHGIRFRVILDLAGEAKDLLAQCEADALRAGCDAMLGLGALKGYFRTGASYILLADGKGPVDVRGKAWRFALIEHDAF